MANRMAVFRRRVSRGLIHAAFSSMAMLVMLSTSGPNASAQADNTSAQSDNASAQPGNGQGAGFLGAWCVQGDASKHASISSNEAFFKLTNENGKSSMGNLTGPNQMGAPDWEFITGTLSHNGRRIDWSNGTFWARCSNSGGSGGGAASGSAASKGAASESTVSGGDTSGSATNKGAASGSAVSGNDAGKSAASGSAAGGSTASKGAVSGGDAGIASGRGGGGGDEVEHNPNLSGIWYSQGNHSLQCTILERHGGLNLHNEHGSSGTGSFDGDHRISTKWAHTRLGGTISQDGNRIDWSNDTYWIRQKGY